MKKIIILAIALIIILGSCRLEKKGSVQVEITVTNVSLFRCPDQDNLFSNRSDNLTFWFSLKETKNECSAECSMNVVTTDFYGVDTIHGFTGGGWKRLFFIGNKNS